MTQLLQKLLDEQQQLLTASEKINQQSRSASPPGYHSRSNTPLRYTRGSSTFWSQPGAEQPVAFLEQLNSLFPGAMDEATFHTKVSTVLASFGFTRETTIALVSVCRDELTNSFVEIVDELWGESFSISSLAGMVFCGKTGFKAGMHHAPCDEGGKERYVFFAGPHIAISKAGRVGEVQRVGRQKMSTACGSLCAVRSELESHRIRTQLDPTDIEQSLVKQAILEELDWGTLPTLEGLTKAAYACVVRQVEQTLTSMSLDPAASDYSVITCIQIHGPNGVNFVWPGTCYIVRNGARTDVLSAIRRADATDLLQDHNRQLAAHMFHRVAEGDTTAVEQWLVKLGEPNVTDYNGRTALHVAAYEGRADVVELLLDRGLDPSLRDGNDATPLEVAITRGQFDAARSLSRKGVQLSPAFATNEMIKACRVGDRNKVHNVLPYCDRDVLQRAGDGGQTPLMVATAAGHTAVAQYLVEHDATFENGSKLPPLGNHRSPRTG